MIGINLQTTWKSVLRGAFSLPALTNPESSNAGLYLYQQQGENATKEGSVMDMIIACLLILVIVVSTVVSACMDSQRPGGEEEWEY